LKREAITVFSEGERAVRLVLRPARRLGGAEVLLIGYLATAALATIGGLWILDAIAAIFGAPFAGVVLWRRTTTEEIQVCDGRLIVTRRTFGFSRRRSLAMSEIADVVVVDHTMRSDAMFGLTAASGPGFAEIVARDGTRLPLAHGFNYSSETLADLRGRVREMLDGSKL
jgi:hypothetical protein